jgi:DNA-binding GntR family transcriptional regulator
LAAREAAQRITKGESAKLKGLLVSLQEVADREDAEEYLNLNLQLHHSIFSISRNERLARIDVDLSKELHLFRLRGLRTGGGIKVSNDEHHLIVNAILTGDVEKAGHLFENHILSGRDRFLSTIAHEEESLPNLKC